MCLHMLIALGLPCVTDGNATCSLSRTVQLHTTRQSRGIMQHEAKLHLPVRDGREAAATVQSMWIDKDGLPQAESGICIPVQQLHAGNRKHCIHMLCTSQLYMVVLWKVASPAVAGMYIT